MYDEFGNYIGPELESEESGDEGEVGNARATWMEEQMAATTASENQEMVDAESPQPSKLYTSLHSRTFLCRIFWHLF